MELRGCWEERLTPEGHGAGDQGGATPGRSSSSFVHDEPWATPTLDFIPVELLGPAAPPDPPADDQPTKLPPMPLIVADLDETWSERTSLFGDLDR